MKRLLACVLFSLCVAVLTAATAHAAPECQFVLGFKALRDLVGHEIVGECLENERHNASGDGVQQTTGGLLVWRKADNWTAFTDGYRTWINGPNGLQTRLNTQRFPWEFDYAPGGVVATPTPPPAPAATPSPPPAPIPTPTLEPWQQAVDPDLLPALEALRTTAVGKVLYAWFRQTAPRVSFGVAPAGWTSRYYEPPRHEIVIDRALRNESAEVLAALIAWQTVVAYNAQERGPQSQRWRTGADCLAEVVGAEQTTARWWSEKFGRRGLPTADTALERWLNDHGERYHAQTLEAWVTSSPTYREWCAQFGALPPPPAEPTPVRYVDPLLDNIFAMMRTTEFGEALYQAYVGSEVTYVAFDDLADYGFPHSDGLFQVGNNRVLLDDRLRAESLYVRVSALVHELFHARPSRDYTDYTMEECFKEETLAFMAQAKWWYEKFGGYGKPNPTEREVWENNNLNLWLKKRTGAWVRSSDAYQEHCGRYAS